MKLSCTLWIWILSSFFVASIAHADEMITDKSTGLTFPKEISFESGEKQYELEATGVATRKKLIIKVYSIASYLQKDAKNKAPDKFELILSERYAKQLTMKYARDVSVSQMQDAFQDAFKRVFPGQEYGRMQETIAEFMQFFKRGIHKGDEYILRWIPGGNLEVSINEKNLGAIHNEPFAKGVWNIWFGKNSAVDRNDLVSLMR